jgi:hypothetical protein
MIKSRKYVKIFSPFLVLLFILSLFNFGCGSNPTKKSIIPKPIVSATELFNAVRDNREQAISDYNGKEYSIKGTLYSINTNRYEIPYVPLLGDTETYKFVDCYFKKNQKKMLVNTLYEGYEATIYGKIQIHEGLNPNITVENCELITWSAGSGSYANSRPSYSNVVANIGDSIVLDSNGSLVYIAVTKEAFEEKLQYSIANDATGLKSLITSGSFFVVKSGTEAIVIDKLPGLLSPGRRIRIKNGELSGVTGWVGIENCKR